MQRNLALGLLVILGTVALVLVIWAVEAVIFMWLFNIVARYFEWRELSFGIAAAVVILLNLLVGALRRN